MGAWGPAIFSNDRAADVRDEWREALRDGLSAADATAKLTADEPEDDVELWTGLAAAQHETGRLQDEVRDRALTLIDAGGDADLWDGDRRRARALERLASQLRGPQPSPTPLPRAAAPAKVRAGDVLLIRDLPDSIGGDRIGGLFHVVELRPAPTRGPDPIVLRLATRERDLCRDAIAALPYMSSSIASFYARVGEEEVDVREPDLMHVRESRGQLPTRLGRVVQREMPPRFVPPIRGSHFTSDWHNLRMPASYHHTALAHTETRLERFGPDPAPDGRC